MKSRRPVRGARGCLFGWLALASIFTALPCAAEPAALFARGDRVVFLGNTFAERMTEFGYFETLLVSRFSDYELTFRNLAWSADTPQLQPRPYNFGSVHRHLEEQKADVIFLCFGMSESFLGAEGLGAFEKDLRTFIGSLREHRYSGKDPPRLVLVSPIPHETLAEHNGNLARYTEAMRRLATAMDVAFADLFAPLTRLAAQEPGHRLTFNGIHLTQYGYWVVSQILMEQLGLSPRGWRVEVDARSEQVTAAGAEVEWISFPGAAIALEVDRSAVPTPPAPDGAAVPAPLLERQPTLVVTHLEPGNYALHIDNREILRADSDAWARGVGIPRGPTHAALEALRALIVEKNRQFFYRWRAVNGEYIYGRRNGAYGKRTFPPEMKKLDQMIEALEKRIDAAPRSPFVQVFALSRVDDDESPTARDPAAAKKHFQVAPGYAINLFASEKEFPLENPVAMAFDAKGRLWVATMPSYPHYFPGETPDDKLLILEDVDGDGRADKHTVFADKLYLPSGFELGDGGAYIAQEPNIIFAGDTDGDDIADTREIVLHGFGTEDSHHAISAFTWGPGGGLYFHEGEMLHTQVETPFGAVRCVDAGVFRFRPETFELEVFINYHFANPWGHVFDRWGQDFIADASPGANFFALPLTGRLAYPSKHRTIKDFTARMRPSAGCEIVSSRHFPESVQGNFLVNNTIGFRGIKQHRIIEEGSGFTSREEEPLLYSSDKNFRPVALQLGPDGALYVVDWFNPLIGHVQHSLRDRERDHDHGRVWRITYPERPLLDAPEIAGEPVVALLDLLRAYEDRTRYRVRRELREHAPENVAAELAAWTRLDSSAADYEHLLLEALWIYQTIDVVEPDLLKKLLRAGDGRARAAATRVLRFWRGEVPDAFALLQARVHDEHPRVRLEAVVALSDFTSATAAEAALAALKYPTDYYLDYGILETITTLEPYWKPVVLAGEPFAPDHPQALAYAVERLSTEELRQSARGEAVYTEILRRHDIEASDDAQYRIEALQGLARLHGTDEATETVLALERIDATGGDHAAHLLHQVGQLLLRYDALSLRKTRDRIEALTLPSRRPLARQLGYAAWVQAEGSVERVWERARKEGQLEDLLDAAGQVPSTELRAQLFSKVQRLLSNKTHGVDLPLRQAALRATVELGARETETFRQLAAAFDSDDLRATAVAALRRLPSETWPAAEVEPLGTRLVAYFDAVSADERSSLEFQEALALGDAIASVLPPPQAEPLRRKLAGLAVRVIIVRTVPHQMAYDKKHLYVEAGQAVDMVFENTDIMPHNLLITVPGAMQEVGEAAERMALYPDAFEKHFIPATPKVLHATRLLPPGESQRLRFTAPTEIGDYPYVCTFPGHWRIMNGVLHVVEKVDEASIEREEGLETERPSTRSFVRDWTFDDTAPLLEQIDAGGNYYAGRTAYRASCAQCHQISNKGKPFGPNLTDVSQRLKRHEILRAIVEPSHAITKDFESHVIVTTEGHVATGLIVAQNDDVVKIVDNPLKRDAPTEIPRDKIASQQASKLSLMPTGLLNTFTAEEILELLVFIEAGGDKEHVLYGGF